MELSAALRTSPQSSIPVHTVPSTAYQNQTTSQGAGQPCLEGPESLPGFRVICAGGSDSSVLFTEVVRVPLPPETLVANLRIDLRLLENIAGPARISCVTKSLVASL